MSRRGKERREKAQRETYRSAYRRLAAQREFRMWLYRLVEQRCGLFADAFDTNGSQQSKNLGRQQVGRELMQEALAIAPHAWVEAMAEEFMARAEAIEAEQRQQDEAEEKAAQGEPDDG